MSNSPRIMFHCTHVDLMTVFCMLCLSKAWAPKYSSKYQILYRTMPKKKAGASSKSKASSPPRGGGRAGSNNGPNSRVPRMLGVAGADVLAPPDYMSDLGADPFPWTECLGTGGPLLFADLLRWQVSALQVRFVFLGARSFGQVE